MKALITLIVSIVVFSAPAMAQESTNSAADTNMEILMQKVEADKKLLVAGNMDLDDVESKKFWPLYNEYQKELEKINEQLGRTIKEYADAFNQGKGTISNETAKKLLDEALSVEESELKLKRSYADKISKVLPATKTARFIQIENKIRAAIRAQLAQQIPLVY